jgi:spatacsin
MQVYKHFDMKHEAASLLESRAEQYMKSWLLRQDKERRNDELLKAMHDLVQTAEVLSTIDAGQRTHRACARASLLSLQIRIPDLVWIGLTETNARRIFVDQSRFQEALIVAEAYSINQPMEWAPVFWNQMPRPDLIELFVAEFVLVLPLQPPMLVELARFYRAGVAARGEQPHFSAWLSPVGLPAEWVNLGRSFRSLLRRTRDMRLRLQLATLATGFSDVVDVCNGVLDKVPEKAGPLILRKGHGGAYLPLM